MIYIKLKQDGESLDCVTLKRQNDQQIPVARDFFTEYPMPCWKYDGESLVLRVDADDIRSALLATPENTPPRLSPLEFKMCLTSAERISIRGARETDPIIDDFMDLIEDPRLKVVDMSLQSNVDAIDYCIAQGHIAVERREDILAGVML